MGMRSWSIPAGQWFGINVRVHLTFFFLLLFVWITQSQSKTVDPSTFLRSLAFTGIVMGAGLAHELGHLAVALRGGPLPRAIILLPIGSLSRIVPSLEETPHLTHHPITPQLDLRLPLSVP